MKIEKGTVTADIMGDQAVIHIRLRSVCDLSEAKRILDDIGDIVYSQDLKVLVINFSRMSRFTSVFITNLIALNKSLRESGMELRFCAMSRQVEEAFRIGGLQKLFRMFRTEEEALSA